MSRGTEVARAGIYCESCDQMLLDLPLGLIGPWLALTDAPAIDLDDLEALTHAARCPKDDSHAMQLRVWR